MHFVPGTTSQNVFYDTATQNSSIGRTICACASDALLSRKAINYNMNIVTLCKVMKYNHACRSSQLTGVYYKIYNKLKSCLILQDYVKEEILNGTWCLPLM